MRDLLTGLAIVLIVVLTAALAAPYFIDWNGQRAFVEARLSHALGQKVTIGGSIDVKLLPTPYIVLDQAVIGSDDGPIRIGIHHLDLQLSVAPLLHGAFEVVDAALEEPTITIRLEPDRTLPALPDAPAFRADVAFDRVSVNDGTLAIADPRSGRTFVLDNLDLTADAPSLAGPFKISGTEGAPTARTPFRLSTTTADRGRARAHLIVTETAAHAGLDLDGTVALTSAGRDTVRQSFDGTLALFGHLAGRAPVAWRLAGPLKADPSKAALAGGELRLGGEDGLTLAASGEADLGGAPALHVDLTAKQLDIDRLAAGAGDASSGPSATQTPPRLPDLASLRGAFLAAATPPLPTTVDLSIDTATWGGDTLSDLAAHVGLGGRGPRRLQIGGDGPGGTHVGADGMLSPGATPSFSGAVELSADNLPRAVAWLASVDPDVTLTAADVPFQSVKLSGKVKADATAIEAGTLALSLGRSALSGSARLALGGRRPKLTADLKAQALDLDALPDIAVLRRGTAAADLDLALSADAIKVTHAGGGTLDAGPLDLALTTSDRRLTLTRFRARDLGGASVIATGRLDPTSAALKATIDAAHLDAFAALVRQVAPNAWSDAFVARAPVLAPAKLDIDVALAAESPDAPLRPTRTHIDGTLGATAISLRVDPSGGDTRGVSITGSLRAPEGSALLRQLGLATLPLDVVGASGVTISASGRADQPLDTSATATFGTTRATLSGHFDLLGAARRGSGTLTVRGADVSPLLQSLAVAFPDMTGAVPLAFSSGLALDGDDVRLADLKGRFGTVEATGSLRVAPRHGDAQTVSGDLALDHLAASDLFALAFGPPQGAAAGMAWSGLRFGAGLLDPPRATVALKIGRLDLTPPLALADATLDLGLAPNIVTLKHMRGTLDGGHTTADLTLRRDAAIGALEGKVALHDVAIDLPGLRARASGTLDLAGSGSSALALVESLAGTGTATLADARVPGADPAALPEVFADVESDALAVDQDMIARALQEKAGGALALGTRSFGLALVGGTLRIEEKDAPEQASSPVATAFGATLDLRQPTFDEKVRETLRALPKDWSGTPPAVVFAFEGAPTAPKRSIDVSAFIDTVATRALARETARIEAYELDIRERAVFNQRLLSERRREQDRLKAEADARKAEADRKARIEAAKLEKIRKDEAAKAARAAEAQAARDQAAQDKPARDRGPEPPLAAQPVLPPTSEPFAPSGAATDPSAAGRY